MHNMRFVHKDKNHQKQSFCVWGNEIFSTHDISHPEPEGSMGHVGVSTLIDVSNLHENSTEI